MMSASAMFRLVLRTVDTPATVGALWLGGWRLRNPHGVLCSAYETPPAAATSGHHVQGLYPTLLAALAHVPAGSTSIVLNTADHFTKELCRTPADRQASFYLTSGKPRRPLKDATALRAIDELLTLREIQLSAGRPETFQDMDDYAELTHKLEVLKEDAGKEPGWQY